MTSAIDPNFITTDPVSKAGMRTQLQTAADEISALQASLAAKFNSTGGTLTGNVTINASNPVFNLRKTASGQSNFIIGLNGSTTRWAVNLGNSTAESGSNVGSDFDIQRHNDAGTLLDKPLTISRSTGIITFPVSPIAPTPASGDNTTKLATTAFLRNEFTGTNQVMAQPGLQKFPGGFQIKFGSASTVSGVATVTYATAFPTGTLCAVVTPIAGATFTGNPLGTQTASYAPTGFNVYGDAGDSISFTWIALGF